MFGYIRPYKPECKIREHEYYRGVYCGLCRALGACGGVCARLTLTYDFTFLLLVRMAIVGEKPQFAKRRCLAHPLKRHPEAAVTETSLFCAGASLLLAHGKLVDDIADETGLRRARARLLRPFTGGFCRKTRRTFTELDKTIKADLAVLSALEAELPRSIDRPAALFGRLMADILSFGLDGNASKLAENVGMALGKWVYLIDAIDDLEKDIEKERYNPLRLVYGDGPLEAEQLGELEVTLLSLLADAACALDLVDYPDTDMRGVIENHLRLGLPHISHEILSKKETSTHA